MKKTLLLCATMLLGASPVWAETSGHNFLASGSNLTFDALTPQKGTGFISTDVSLARRKYVDDNGVVRKKNASEFMGYALTDRWTFYAQFSRDWMKVSQNITAHSKEDSWFVGSGYRFIDDGKNLFNGIVTYGQKNNSLGGGVTKAYSVYGIYAYNFDTFSPHSVLEWNQSINLGKKNDEEWYWYGGVGIPLSPAFGLELGVDYDRQASAYRMWTGYASVAYSLNDFISTEVYGQHVFSSSVKHHTDNYKIKNDYTFGLRLTTSF